MGDPWLDILAAEQRMGTLNYERYLQLEAGMANRLAHVAADLTGRDYRTLMLPALAATRSSARHRIPLATFAALVHHESGGWVNEGGDNGIGYVQMIPRYAPDHWPYELPPHLQARRGAMQADVAAQFHAAADMLRDKIRSGFAARDEAGSITYADHYERNRDLFASKGGDPSKFPRSPVRWFRNPWLAMYNRGGRGGKWPRLDAPMRADGSSYQVTIENLARQYAPRLVGAPAVPTQSDWSRRSWLWSTD